MRATMGIVLTCNAALLATVTACTGTAPKPQAGATIEKNGKQVVARPAQSGMTTERPTPQAKPDLDNKNLTADVETPSANASTGDEPTANGGAKQVKAQRAPTVLPAAMPEVVLTKAHADDCLIRVGDEFPEFRLPDLRGRMQSLEDLRGDSLTVVVFWSGDRLLAADQLRYLNEQIVRYSDLGVRAIAVNTGQSPEKVREATQNLKLHVPMLLDLDGGLFSRVGKAHLPRTYLLDREGSVLWLDIEFSRHTRDGLEQAIHASLEST
jgi:peroxiredoxin